MMGIPWSIVCLFMPIGSCWSKGDSNGSGGSVVISGGIYNFMSTITGITKKLCTAQGGTWSEQNGGQCTVTVDAGLCTAYGGTWFEHNGGACIIDPTNLVRVVAQTSTLTSRSSEISKASDPSFSVHLAAMLVVWLIVLTLLGLSVIKAYRALQTRHHRRLETKDDLEVGNMTFAYKDGVGEDILNDYSVDKTIKNQRRGPGGHLETVPKYGALGLLRVAILLAHL